MKNDIKKIAIKRIEWIDVAKYICIMFVMLSHLESGSEFLDFMYTPFFLTVFFFCSGYVYKNGERFKYFIHKKVKGLLIPWFIFSNFNIILSAIISFNKHESLTSEFIWNIIQIRGLGDGMWFVSALFVAFIPFYFLVEFGENKIKDKKHNYIFIIVFSWILSLLSIIYTKYMDPGVFPWKSTALPWHMEYIFQAVFFMILGYYFKVKFEEIFDRFNNQLNRFIIWCLYLFLVFILYIFNNEMALPVKIIVNYIIQVTGIISIVMLSKLIKPGKYINFVGSNTILYFALHGKVLSIIQTIMKRVIRDTYEIVLSNPWSSSFLSICLTYIISLILIIPVYLIVKYMPFTLGRKIKKIDITKSVKVQNSNTVID